MNQIIINKCYGGFNLSPKAFKLYAERKFNWTNTKYNDWSIENLDTKECITNSDINRTDPILIEIVQELEDNANGECARLIIDTIPITAIMYRINEYDGYEDVEYIHSTSGWQAVSQE